MRSGRPDDKPVPAARFRRQRGLAIDGRGHSLLPMAASAGSTSGESGSKRLRSLDALRGFDMLWIVGLAQFFREWAKVDHASWLSRMNEQLTHVDWAGLHAYDLIFPTFMFLSGLSIPYAMAGKSGSAGSRGKLLIGVWRRALTLVLLGAVYNGLLKLDFAHQRWASVLGQIGLAYGIAATVFLFTKSWKGRAIFCAFVLILVTVLQLLVPVPGYGAGVLTQEGIFNAWLDRRFLPGRLNGEVFDPEGILCVVCASALTMSGVITGSFLKSRGDSPRLANVLILWTAGALAVGAGVLCVKAGYPSIKSAWNPPFNFLAAGIAAMVFAVFHLLVDFVPFNWSLPLQVVGMNPLTIYLGNKIVPFLAVSTFFFGGLAARMGKWEQMVLWGGMLLIEWLVLWFLYRKKVFMRV